MEDNNVEIVLSADEALVLLDWLARTTEQAHPAPFNDQAEQRVLWDLEASLESILTAPLDSNYAALIEAARGRIRDPSD
ncbi:hypothetical protein EYE40_07475 [Glaciihabitans arcticus]|uniref:Uncharacterized protein n=1 Tax=Glaciihabitans arcticus TaxID=2668039 RepID=A0A4Q9GY79_9MICO|nr:hypothetical protein EYE40_07475 [Glaciihabitans arcticus]